MEVRELRIGNLIFVNDVPEKVWGIDLDLLDEGNEMISVGKYDVATIKHHEPGTFKPIPLTEELFKKLGNGFTFAENFSCYWYDGCVCIEQFGEGTEKLEHIKYVHQYQNFHYALTNTELTIYL